MKESEWKKDFIKWAEKEYNCLVISHQKTNKNGFFDLQVLMSNGLSFFIEGKIKGSKQTPLQKAIFDRVISLGQLAFVCYDLDEAQRITERMMNYTREI